MRVDGEAALGGRRAGVTTVPEMGLQRGFEGYYSSLRGTSAAASGIFHRHKCGVASLCCGGDA